MKNAKNTEKLESEEGWNQKELFKDGDEKWFGEQVDSYDLGCDVEMNKFFEILEFYRWNYKPECPFCKTKQYRQTNDFFYECNTCDKTFDVTTNTPLEGWGNENIFVGSALTIYCKGYDVDGFYEGVGEDEEWMTKTVKLMLADFKDYLNPEIKQPIFQLKWLINQSKKIKKMAKKTINEYLFDQLQRLDEANESNIEVEMNKATHIIAITEQLLDVARLKLQIIQSNVSVSENFVELDKADDNKQLSNGNEQ